MLTVSDNRRYLVQKDGTPFFYLGDTAWELFHRLTLEEATEYLRTRAQQGFNVIHAVALAEFDGLTEPNRKGDLPLHNLDPTRPNEAYFAHVDADCAERYALVEEGARQHRRQRGRRRCGMHSGQRRDAKKPKKAKRIQAHATISSVRSASNRASAASRT